MERVVYKTLKNGSFCVENREICFDEEYAIVVVGCGTAGSTAALAAAKSGLKTLVIEKCTSLGGTSVNGGVLPYYYGTHGAIGTEKNARAGRILENGLYMPYKREKFEGAESLAFSGAVTARAIEELLYENGCEVWLQTIVTGVYVFEKKVVGLELFADGRFRNVALGAAIDSCDGEVCRLLGSTLTAGRAYDGREMKYSRYVGLAYADGIRGGSAHCGYLNGCDAGEYAKNLLRAASEPPCLKASYGGERAVVFHSSIVGRRETGQVETLKKSTIGDWFSENNKEPVFYAFANLDNPNEDFYAEDDDVQDWNFLVNAHAYGLRFPVQKDNLRPKIYENVFLAGKHLGVDRSVLGFVRMKADLEKCGVAAATMAGVYLQTGGMDYAELQKRLTENGTLERVDGDGLYHLNYRENGWYKPLKLPRTVAEIIKCFYSSEPELGFLGALRYARGKSEQEGLLRRMNETDGDVKEHIAIALGLLKNPACLPVLREIVSRSVRVIVRKDPSRESYPWLAQTVHCNYAKAVCLLTRFKDSTVKERLRTVYSDGASVVTRALPFPYEEKYKELVTGFIKKYLERV